MGQKNAVGHFHHILLPISGSYIMYNNYVEKSEQSVEVVCFSKLDRIRKNTNYQGDQILMDLLNLAQKGITDSTRFIDYCQNSFPSWDNSNLNNYKE
ncbi:hypothetical protein MWN41_00195 [Ornithobacterium rhinotracheale]|uniref:hypothetical protein n=1 Tax=Ornithobacterium rhinotracheale TaxID=28251 RepID=UPI001FF4078E|nr:hypothetical protein [Ornithobacterium rhinotracheale]MCK0201443.1 hypothetical protein [Ornithobacterium rhinotracheale]